MEDENEKARQGPLFCLRSSSSPSPPPTSSSFPFSFLTLFWFGLPVSKIFCNSFFCAPFTFVYFLEPLCLLLARLFVWRLHLLICLFGCIAVVLFRFLSFLFFIFCPPPSQEPGGRGPGAGAWARWGAQSPGPAAGASRRASGRHALRAMQQPRRHSDRLRAARHRRHHLLPPQLKNNRACYKKKGKKEEEEEERKKERKKEKSITGN